MARQHFRDAELATAEAEAAAVEEATQLREQHQRDADTWATYVAGQLSVSACSPQMLPT